MSARDNPGAPSVLRVESGRMSRLASGNPSRRGFTRPRAIRPESFPWVDANFSNSMFWLN